MDSSSNSNSFDSPTNVNNGTKEFLESNSLVAKVAFLLLVLFGFVLLFTFGMMIIGQLFGPPTMQKLVNGMVDGHSNLTLTQDPTVSGSKTISRSQNASDGIEFTWSVWLFLDPPTDSQTSNTYKHVFHKGNSAIADTGLNFPNNAPGLYIAPSTNALVVIMNTYNVINEEIVVQDIPLNKWVNVVIRCVNTKLDVYINGSIAKSHMLHGVPKQNYGDIFVGINGGFQGNLSNLWYYNYALGTYAIQQLASSGADTTASSSSGVNAKTSDYLSLRWYFYGASNPAAAMMQQKSAQSAQS